MFTGKTKIMWIAGIFAWLCHSALEAEPVARWALDEVGGTSVRESFHGYTGQLEGNAAWVNDSRFGRVLSLDGSNDAVRVANNADLNPQRLGLSGWIWLSSSGSGTRQILSKDLTSSWPHKRVWQFRVRSDRSLELIVFNSTTHGAARGGTIDTDRWVHVAGTWDGETVRVFVDAVEVAQKAFTGTLRQNQSNAVYLGRSENSNRGYFKGRLADMRIFDEAIEWAEVRRLMDHPHLVGHWPLADASDLYRDAAGLNHGAAQGDPQPFEDSLRGRSLQLDASGDAVNLGPLGLEPRRATLAAWIRTLSPEYRAYQIFSKDRTTHSTQRAWQFRVDKRNKLQFIAFNSAGQATIITGTKLLNDLQWHHVAVTIDGSHLRLYVDGEQDGAAVPFAAQLAQGTTNAAFIGRSENGSAGYFAGYIHDVRLYDRALSGDELEKLGVATAGAWNDWVQAEAQGTVAPTHTGDFSYSGYHHGERVWPEILVPNNLSCNPGTGGRQDDGQPCSLGGETGSCRLFDVTCFGANANGSGNSLPAVEAAIQDAVSYRTDTGPMDQRLVIYFPPGTYTMLQQASGGGLSVNADRVVLKGAGKDQTTLRFHPDGPPLPLDAPPFLIRFYQNTSDPTPCLRSVFQDQPTVLGNIVQAAPRGTFSVVVDNLTKALDAGEWVTVRLRDACDDSDGCPHFEELVSPRTIEAGWTRGAYITERHRLAQTAGVGSNVQLTFDAPLHIDVGAQGWQLTDYETIEEVGLEDMRIEGGWQESFCHRPVYNSGCTGPGCSQQELEQYHLSGWSGVCFDGVVNGWIDSVEMAKWNRGIRLFDTSSSSVLRTRFVGNANDLLPRPSDVTCNDSAADAVTEHGHESIRVRGGTGNLVGDTREEVPFWHGPSVSFSAGSTVFWRYVYSGTTAFDAHAMCPYATLIDDSRGGVADKKSGGPTVSQPNHLERFVLWNFTSTGPDPDGMLPAFTFWNDQDATFANFVEPVVVGYQDFGRALDTSTFEIYESPGSFVAPQSLYEGQLEMRLGQPPEWICHLKQNCDIHTIFCSGFESCSVLP